MSAENGPPEPSAPERIYVDVTARFSDVDGIYWDERVRESDIEYVRVDAAERVIRERVVAEIEGEAYVLECVEDGVGATFQAAQHLRRAARRVRSRNEGGA